MRSRSPVPAPVPALGATLALGPVLVALAAFGLSGCIDRGGLDTDPPTGGTSGSGGRSGSGATGGGGRAGTGGRGAGGQTMCPAPCPILCPNGVMRDANGCELCACNPPICPTIACGNMCPNGYVVDATTGCPTCMCRPTCPDLDCMACPYGYVKDASGCDTCRCNPMPVACTQAECGTPPPSVAPPIICPAVLAAPAADGAGVPSSELVIAPGAVCRRNADGKCVWEPGGRCCPGVACDIACPNGYQLDASGCAICACKPPVVGCGTGACGTAPTTPVICSSVVGGGGVGDQAPGAPIIAPPGGSGGSSGVGGGSGALPRPLVCQADAAGVCSWQPVPGCRFCGPVSCRLACPYGFRKDASGCEICECNPDPAADCGRYADYMTCTASMACTWLQPGCGDPALAAAGCYARSSLNCTSDAQCTSGRQCLKRVINPCAVPPGGVGGCAACGQTISLCQ